MQEPQRKGGKIPGEATGPSPPPIMITLRGHSLAEAADSFAVGRLPAAAPRRIAFPHHDLTLAVDETYTRGRSPGVDALLAMMSRGFRLASQDCGEVGQETAEVALLTDRGGRLNSLVFFEKGPGPLDGREGLGLPEGGIPGARP